MMQPNPRPVTCTGHEPVWCDSPGCPGKEIHRRLEAFDELLAELKEIRNGWAEREARGRYDLNPWETERLSFVRKVIDLAEGR